MKVFGMVTTAHSHGYTEPALRTFFETTPLDPNDRFLLIDNDADYDEEVLKAFPRVEHVRNPNPLGFAQNANQAVDVARSEGGDLYFLNNDLIFTDGWLEPLLSDEPIIMSPLSNRELQYDCEIFTSRMTMFLSEYEEQKENLPTLIEAHRQQYNGYLQVLAVPFFCVKLPLEVMNGVGHFDEIYGRGGAEDYDYCLRAILAGYRVKYALQSYIIHFGGKSSWSGPEQRKQQEERELHFRSMFAAKWGLDLTEVLLFETKSKLEADASVLSAIEQGNHKYVVETLQGQNKPTIYL